MRELIKHYSLWDLENERNAGTITVWKDGDNYYQQKHEASTGAGFDLESLPAPNRPIPLELFRGRWESSLTESPNPPPGDSFLKKPAIFLLDDLYLDPHSDWEPQNDPTYVGPRDAMLEEAKIYELLKQHPHPNISVYFGCVRDGDCFTAICLKRYTRSLQDAVNSKDPLNTAAIVDGISKGSHFLHDTLRLVHNDINPRNIMLDEEGNAVIIDFDSCMPIGEKIWNRKGGTIPWTNDADISLPENDLFGLDLIAKFLEGTFEP